MGATCINFINSGDNKEIVFVNDIYKDFKSKRYSSPNDVYYQSFEKNINLLKYINISEFVYSLANFHFDSVSYEGHSISDKQIFFNKSSFFGECINQDQLMLYIHNKIIQHPYIYDMAISPEAKEIYSDFFLKLYETVRKGYLSYVKIHNSQNQTRLDKKTKKFFLLAMGVLLCGGDNLTRLDIIFSIFANDLNKLEKKSIYFNVFIFLKFLTASYGILRNLDDLSPLNPDYYRFNFSTTEKDQIYEKFEFHKILTLKENFINQFFENAYSLSYDEYKQKIINDGQDWFLTSQGIRKQLI